MKNINFNPVYSHTISLTWIRIQCILQIRPHLIRNPHIQQTKIPNLQKRPPQNRPLQMQQTRPEHVRLHVRRFFLRKEHSEETWRLLLTTLELSSEERRLASLD